MGVATAVSFAWKGYRVLGVDPDRKKLQELRSLRSPFFEPRIDEYLKHAISNGLLELRDTPPSRLESDFSYITVGTPSQNDGAIDLAYVENATIGIGRALRHSDRYQMVVIKSTVTPGTARTLVKPLLEKQSRKVIGQEIGLCSNPEFLREGNAIRDSRTPDRIIIGSDDRAAATKLDNFYREFHSPHFPPVIRTTHENAELIKYANNAFLATKVSFINTIANIAERTPTVDIETIARGIGLDKRIAPEFLRAGLGWGGSCFPKDVKALVSFSEHIGYEPALLTTVLKSNTWQKHHAIGLAKHVLGSLKNKRIAILGLAFKPGTDDIREAVSITVIRQLLAEGCKVTSYDPAAIENTREMFGDRIEYASSAADCLTNADCCLIVTEWEDFKALSPGLFRARMRQPIVIDGRRIFDVGRFENTGVKLISIGLGPTS